MTVESVNRIVKFGIYQELVSALFYNRFRIADLTIYSTICQCTGLDLELIVRKKEQPVGILAYFGRGIVPDIGIRKT